MKILLISNKKKLTIILGIILLVILFSFLNKKEVNTYYHQSEWNEYSREVERAVSNFKGIEKIKLSHVDGLVLSHHIPTTIPKLVGMYLRLKNNQSVDKFIVIGPDHTDSGSYPITASNASFFTTYGEVKPIKELVSILENKNLLHVDEKPFDKEHSVGSQILIISKIFPEAKVLPIIFRSDVSHKEAESLGREIAKIMDEKTVLVASIDFSHYLSSAQALPIDKISGDIIRNLDVQSFSLIKADSDKSVESFIWSMKSLGASFTDQFSVMNTNDFMQNSDYTTGYVFGFWGRK